MPDSVKTCISVLVKEGHGTSREEDVTREWGSSFLKVQQNPFLRVQQKEIIQEILCAVLLLSFSES